MKREQKFSLDSLKGHQWMIPIIVFFTQLKGESLNWHQEFEEEEIQKFLQELYHFVAILELEDLISTEERELFISYHTELQYNIHEYEMYCQCGFDDGLDIPRLSQLMIKLVKYINC